MTDTASLLRYLRTQAGDDGFITSDYLAAARALNCSLSHVIALSTQLEREHRIRPLADGRWFVNTRRRLQRLRGQLHPQLRAFCQEHGIAHSQSFQSFYFTLGGQKFRLSNHSVELANLGRTLMQLPLVHPEGREADVIYIHAPKEQLIPIYTQLAREYPNPLASLRALLIFVIRHATARGIFGERTMARRLAKAVGMGFGEAAAAVQRLQSAGLAERFRSRATGAALLRFTAAAVDLLSAPAASTEEKPAPSSASSRERKMRDLENRLLNIYRRQATSGGLFNMNNKIAMQSLGLDNPGVLYLARRLVERGCIAATCGRSPYRWMLVA